MLSYWAILATASVGVTAELTLDPKLKYWVLLPISIVMVLAGILRQYITVLITPKLKGQPRVKLTESQYTIKAQALLANGSNLSKESFELRKDYLAQVLTEGKYLAIENKADAQPLNPLNDPTLTDSMMAMAKGNMANFIPQTLIRQVFFYVLATNSSEFSDSFQCCRRYC